LKQTEADVEKQRIKIEQTESSLYGGRVQNPKELQDLQNIEVVGLMTMAPLTDDGQLLHQCFRKLKNLQI
jgi:uncharacterized pyridoxal phosphate-containing UPF0001 family protein